MIEESGYGVETHLCQFPVCGLTRMSFVTVGLGFENAPGPVFGQVINQRLGCPRFRFPRGDGQFEVADIIMESEVRRVEISEHFATIDPRSQNLPVPVREGNMPELE